MTKRNEWEEFFDGHAPVYMENSFTKNTTKEVDFLLEEFKLPPGSSILDIGCGTGRHSVELAIRRYQVTGVDMSSGMLAEAKKTAKRVGVEVEFIQADATQFKSDKLFDAAICLCEGAFSLLGKDDDFIEHDLAILENIQAALKPEARFILTAPNGCRLIRQISQEDVEAGRFDPVTMVELFTVEWDTPEGKKSSLVRGRNYLPTEIVMLLRYTGFEVENIWGGTAGKWGRRKINLDEMEMMVVSKKHKHHSIV